MGGRPGARRAEGLFSAGLTLVGVLGLSTMPVVLALQTAGGIRYLGGTSYQTEFANPRWWEAGFIFFAPVFAASWRHPRFAAVHVIAALAPQVALPVVIAHRYAVTGRGDGLETLGYLFPILMAPLFSAAAALGAAVGKRWQA